MGYERNKSIPVDDIVADGGEDVEFDSARLDGTVGSEEDGDDDGAECDVIVDARIELELQAAFLYTALDHARRLGLRPDMQRLRDAFLAALLLSGPDDLEDEDDGV